ncbi:hypothetical protein AB0J86_23555 [Micromonospora sp. NPDC049559]|uniref:hypothetical protein n=1 Tax=Micromonospora sp. NPDC049559 TaxID=3155923 RepID=UPI0034242FE2
MSHPTRRRPSPPLLAALLAAVAVVAQALLIPLFAAPAANLAPRDLPIVVAGPAPGTTELANRLAAAQPGAFEILVRPDAAAAERALHDREAYAAFVVGPAGPVLYTAPAASPTVASLLVQGAAELSGGRPPRVVEVVRADPDDPRGSGFGAGFLPLGMTSVAVAVLLSLLLPGRVARLAGLLAYGVLAGLGAVAVWQGWLGVLPGAYLADAAAVGLFALATAATVAGLGALLGRAGIGLGVLVAFLLGNALGAVNAAPELLPQPWGTVGRWLPIGAGADLIRSTAFFDGAAAARPLGLLAGYAIVGLLLVLVGRAAVIPRHTAR